MYERYLKRGLDALVAGIGVVVAAVPMAAIAAAIRTSMGPPVLFRQHRTGRSGKRFEMLKFRTMDHARPHDDRTSAERITKLGRFLRSTSLDELPQLINVIRGDMSLVGPRPLLPSYDALYSPTQQRRFEVRPGITGQAQVSGRSQLSWSEKFAHDVAYVDDISLRRDFAILWATVRQLSDRTSTTTISGGIQERFDGTN